MADRRAAAAGPATSTSHADQVARFFDAKAATWSAKYTAGGPLTDRLSDLLAAVSKTVPAGSRVLDLGCGTGELARALVYAGLRVVACDVSEPMLRHVARPGRSPCRIRLDARWRRLPFTSGAFDAVVAASVLEYLEDPAAALHECARVLRHGGMLICTVPDMRHPVRWLEHVAWGILRVAPVGAAASRWPQVERYRTYLAMSRQRHTARWWLAAGRRTGLEPVTCPLVVSDRRSTLRLLAFRRNQSVDSRS